MAFTLNGECWTEICVLENVLPFGISVNMNLAYCSMEEHLKNFSKELKSLLNSQAAYPRMSHVLQNSTFIHRLIHGVSMKAENEGLPSFTVKGFKKAREKISQYIFTVASFPALNRCPNQIVA